MSGVTIAFTADGTELSRFDWESTGKKIKSSDAFDTTKRSRCINFDQIADEIWTPKVIHELLGAVLQNMYNTTVGELGDPSQTPELETHYKFACNAICNMMLLQDIPWRIDGCLLQHIYTMMIDQWSQLGNYDETVCDFADWLAQCHANNVAYICNGKTIIKKL